MHMTTTLNETEFTDYVTDQLGRYAQLEVSSPEPLTVAIVYGVSEPVLTLKLGEAYEEYKTKPEQLSIIIQPLVTEVGWTANGRRYSFSDVSDHTLPLMRDLKRMPFAPEEKTPNPAESKGPLVYRDLVNRHDEQIIVQLVLAKNELVQPLYLGDALRSCPDPGQLMMLAVHNLRRHVLEIGLTLSEYPIENFSSLPWLVGLRQGKYREFLSSLITVPEVMDTLQKTLNAESGLVAIIPSREQLVICAEGDDEVNTQMGLLARHLKGEANDPVSSYIWHFQNGILNRVQTVDCTEADAEPESL
jgi:hypothetical protein